MKLADSVVVITGGGSGIGAAMAQRFAKEGAAHVVVSDRDSASAHRVAEQIGGHARVADVGDATQTQALIDWTEQHLGSVDLFCANAGVTAHGGVDLPMSNGSGCGRSTSWPMCMPPGCWCPAC